MYVRIVRFTDVKQDQIDRVRGEVEGGSGPPEGAPVKGLRVVVDEDQGTAVVVQLYETKEDMEKGAEIFDAMDASDTPGTRASVDAGEEVVRADM
jgi:hypothetical protein